MTCTGRLATVTAGGLALLLFVGSCDKSGPTSPTPVCSFTLTPQEQAFGSDGGPGLVTIGTDAACAWSIGNLEPWITLLSPASGTGPATVRFAVAGNKGETARETTMMVASLPFRVRQDGRAACAFAIAPEAGSFTDEGGSGQIAVSAGDACAWAAASNDPWITITAGAGGRGNGTVAYVVAANAATTGRTGTATVAGRTFTVTQSGRGPSPECTYAVTPVSFTPCMPGGSVTTKITTGPTCRWTSACNVSWLHVSSAGGSGGATLTISYPDNYDAPREGVVAVRWPTVTAGQNVHIAQAGCTYGVTATAFTFSAAGGSGTFSVLQQSQPIECGGPLQDQCLWSARASAAWVAIVSSMPRKGDSPVAFSVAANTGAARSATISVRDKIITISQSAP